ncbi:deoxyribodipyrimidine photo-lyase (single-stranded DNA-specific) [Aquimarina amphilecti]|uniref:Cryptochrome DASH n=1 Tax=Aquimarina amphilecti TaxID=1038014 RepID=A0A1H7FGR3_AQUAM|nr:DASH family cryptochrome [Aquimarina amphilecti]SEK24964.1 deoxyribodipyrimidine photo-lyase (single-stranded DNA-specific) [Aquimarina amphilecti]
MIKTGLVWFRNDLRVSDNASLTKATSSNDKVIAVFCFDPRLFKLNKYGFKKTEKYRARFLIESITELRENLAKLNVTLLTYYNPPEQIIPEVIKDYNVDAVYLQKEWTTEEVTVLEAARDNTNKPDLEWVESYDQFLYHPDDIPFAINEIPKIFTVFRKQCEKLAKVRSEISITSMAIDNVLENPTSIPSLRTLGFDEFEIDSRTAFPFEGGESKGLLRIEDYFWKTNKISFYKKTRNGLLGTGYSSKLSAWLANGSISARTIYYQLLDYEKKVQKNQSTYWLIFELIWRDFFKYVSLKHGNDLFKLEGILYKEYSWLEDMDSINQWILGQTNEPFVNANMIELHNTGWMSNRGRQNVASYFAKELGLDWRIGAAYFESLLIDYDVHSNYGNWQYVSGVGNDPRDRKFNVKLQSERYDPQQKFENLWLQQTLF